MTHPKKLQTTRRPYSSESFERAVFQSTIIVLFEKQKSMSSSHRNEMKCESVRKEIIVWHKDMRNNLVIQSSCLDLIEFNNINRWIAVLIALWPISEHTHTQTCGYRIQFDVIIDIKWKHNKSDTRPSTHICMCALQCVLRTE